VEESCLVVWTTWVICVAVEVEEVLQLGLDILDLFIVVHVGIAAEL